MACHVHVSMASLWPWLAFGHMIPFLELAKLIASKGHRISFVSTPRNIDRLLNLPPSLASLINFIKFPLPHVDNLPENPKATIDVPLNVVPFLKKAYDALQESMTRFLKDSCPDWLLHDYAPYWLLTIAHNFCIPSGCDIMAMRSCVEFELEWLRLLEDIHRKPVLPMGQLPPMTYDSEDGLRSNSMSCIDKFP